MKLICVFGFAYAKSRFSHDEAHISYIWRFEAPRHVCLKISDHANFSVFSDCQNVELLCNILVVADQMLVTRLKEICEVVIATLSKLITEPHHEKTNILVSDLVRHKPGCTAKEDG